jgi:hypothetical protein
MDAADWERKGLAEHHGHEKAKDDCDDDQDVIHAIQRPSPPVPVHDSYRRKAIRNEPPIVNGPVAGWNYAEFRIRFLTSRERNLSAGDSFRKVGPGVFVGGA